MIKNSPGSRPTWRGFDELWSAVLMTEVRVRCSLDTLSDKRAKLVGRLPQDSDSQRILPNTPFAIANLHDLDLRAPVHIGAVRGYLLPLSRVSDTGHSERARGERCAPHKSFETDHIRGRPAFHQAAARNRDCLSLLSASKLESKVSICGRKLSKKRGA